MDNDEYYTKRRAELKHDNEIDGDRMTIGNRPLCQVKVKELKDNQLVFNFGEE